MSKLYAYKGCIISRSNATTEVRRSTGVFLHTYAAIVPLYAIEGAVTKAHGLRPFITSIRAAKEYISDALSIPAFDQGKLAGEQDQPCAPPDGLSVDEAFTWVAGWNDGQGWGDDNEKTV
jgi:hypothetical protein